jgi:hypothetical protein
MGKFSIASGTAFSHPTEAVFDFVTDPSNWGKPYKRQRRHAPQTSNLPHPPPKIRRRMDRARQTPAKHLPLHPAPHNRRPPSQVRLPTAQQHRAKRGWDGRGEKGFCTISYTLEPDVGQGVTLFTRNLTRELPKGVGIPDDLF